MINAEGGKLLAGAADFFITLGELDDSQGPMSFARHSFCSAKETLRIVRRFLYPFSLPSG
jgi:hypothetical protein